MNDIVSTSWLHEQLQKNTGNLVIVDVRFNLMDPKAGRSAYDAGHLPEAVFVDLDEDLSTQPSKHGGRHPLPSREVLADTFGRIGIRDTTKVVVYDDQGGVFASRLWWTLKYLGHDEVAILDGGFSKWVADGFSVTKDIPVQEATSFTVKSNDTFQVADAQEVKAKLNSENTVLIDAREHKRYLGMTEPVDPIAGHIPGAINHFWKDVLTDDGLWKDEEQLKQLFSDISPAQEIIVYCGSGVSACPNVLALKKAGYQNVKLYAGSWSDWITYEDFPIETGERK